MFVVVSGAISAGKSTVVKYAAKDLNYEPLFETVEGHPYLERFYKNPKEFAFRTQSFFLWDRFNKHYHAVISGKDIIADRSIYEDNLFAKLQHLRGDLDDDDYLRTYLPHFTLLCQLLKPPDLLIYLRAGLPSLLHRKARRDREMEKDMDPEYMEQLLGLYEEWFDGYPYPKLLVDTDSFKLIREIPDSTEGEPGDDWPEFMETVRWELRRFGMIEDEASGRGSGDFGPIVNEMPDVAEMMPVECRPAAQEVGA
jgi:deoxyadenosine/deoxycytidine kinase